MTEPDSQETRPDTDLRDHLHQMEAKVRKLRDARNNHNEQGKDSLSSEMLSKLNTKSTEKNWTCLLLK